MELRQAALADAQQKLAQYMRDQGLKSTRQRDGILEVFYSAQRHVSVEDLLRLVQQQTPGVGHATVYRTMRLLVEAGIAQERHFKDGQTRYEPILTDEHHDHLICTICNTIFEFEDADIERRQAEIAQVHGLKLMSHRHEIYGVCQSPETCVHRQKKGR